jgi:hypothetical protein
LEPNGLLWRLELDPALNTAAAEVDVWHAGDDDVFDAVEAVGQLWDILLECLVVVAFSHRVASTC